LFLKKVKEVGAMLPENRVENGSFPIPKLLIDKEDIPQFMEEFKGFHAQ
jgi:hypothetical protein